MCDRHCRCCTRGRPANPQDPYPDVYTFASGVCLCRCQCLILTSRKFPDSTRARGGSFKLTSQPRGRTGREIFREDEFIGGQNIFVCWPRGRDSQKNHPPRASASSPIMGTILQRSCLPPPRRSVEYTQKGTAAPNGELWPIHRPLLMKKIAPAARGKPGLVPRWALPQNRHGARRHGDNIAIAQLRRDPQH